MPPKAVSARNRFNRNDRFRGHGPLLQEARSDPMAGGASTAPVGAAHGRESSQCRGSKSTGTIAFAGMARSYETPAHSA